MTLPFTKMQALGNDFVVIDATREPIDLAAEQARHLADRRRGVGCDQILLIEPSPAPGVDFGYRILNADGSQVGQCGNGVRCVARYVWERGLSDADRLIFATTTARMTVWRDRDDGGVAVDMGEPDFDPAALPMAGDVSDLRVDGAPPVAGAVSMGNPHVLLTVDDVADAPVTSVGPRIERDTWFPQRVNVGFAQVTARDTVRLRVWERGAGETQACGSGACAAVAILRNTGVVDDAVAVHLPGGRLDIHWSGPGAALVMRGPAVAVFDGHIALPGGI